MARLLVLSPDLMFGSRLHASLTAEGHEVELLNSPDALGERLLDRAEHAPGALLVDLTDERFDGVGALERLRREGRLGGLQTLAFYSHVDADVRTRALAAGFDLVVPRSRMAREAPLLVAQLGI